MTDESHVNRPDNCCCLESSDISRTPFWKRVRGRSTAGVITFRTALLVRKVVGPAAGKEEFALGSLLLSLDLGRRGQNRMSRNQSAGYLDWEDKGGWTLCIRGGSLARVSTRHVRYSIKIVGWSNSLSFYSRGSTFKRAIAGDRPAIAAIPTAYPASDPCSAWHLTWSH